MADSIYPRAETCLIIGHLPDHLLCPSGVSSPHYNIHLRPSHLLSELCCLGLILSQVLYKKKQQQQHKGGGVMSKEGVGRSQEGKVLSFLPSD
jgi:hypothetical protein